MKKIRSLLTLVALLPFIANEVSAAAFTLIGDLPGGRINGSARAVSADGAIVVGSGENINGDTAAFIWNAAGGLVQLPFASTVNFTATARALSGNGSRIVGQARNNFNENQAATWTRQVNGSYTVSLLILSSDFYQSFEPNYSSDATAVSTDGNTIVGSGRAAPRANNPNIAANSFYGWVYRTATPGNLTLVPDLPGGRFTSFARGISGNGQIVAGLSSSANRPTGIGTNNEAISFDLSSSTSVALGDLRPDVQEYLSEAQAISRDGSTIVGRGRLASGADQPAFRRTASEGMVSLGDLPGGPAAVNSSALAVNATGNVIVGYGTTAAGSEAFVWTPDLGMRRLATVAGLTTQQLNGGRLEDALGISDDGRTIVGTLIRNNPANANLPFREAYRVTLTQAELFPNGPPTLTAEQLAALANLKASHSGNQLKLTFQSFPALAIRYTLQYSPDLQQPFVDQLTFTPNGSGGIVRGASIPSYIGTADGTAILPLVSENLDLSLLPARGFWRVRFAAQP